ncbi:MAG: hypothetical protein IPH32_19110 [Bacteroidetes bacterium]|nr:hypothetical protein [Bacteroidota bacterium]
MEHLPFVPFGTSIVQLTSSATGTVLWSNGQTTPTITVNTSGSYTVSRNKSRNINFSAIHCFTKDTCQL